MALSSLSFITWALFLCAITLNGDHVYLSPPASKSGADVGLIYIPGAKIKPLAYRPLLEATQSHFPQPLHVAIAAFVEGLATEFEIAAELPLLLEELQLKVRTHSLE